MSEVVTLNVGGVIYPTTLSTLTKFPDSMLGAMFSGNYTPVRQDVQGHHFVDRDGRMFCYVLNFLRSNKLCLPNDFQDFALLEAEVDFYQIPPLICAVQELKQTANKHSGCILEVMEISFSTDNLISLEISGPKDILEMLPIPQRAKDQGTGTNKCTSVCLFKNNIYDSGTISDIKMDVFQFLELNNWQLASSTYLVESMNPNYYKRNKLYIWRLPKHV